jgi:hypothetical protein
MESLGLNEIPELDLARYAFQPGVHRKSSCSMLADPLLKMEDLL